jgi:hypothetical protein
MNDEPIIIAPPSPEYTRFLNTVRDHGAHVGILETKEGEKPEIKYYYIRMGASTESHCVTDANLVLFVPLTREQRRKFYPKKPNGIHSRATKKN